MIEIDAAFGVAGPVAAMTIEWKNGFASLFDAVSINAQMVGQTLIPGSMGILSAMMLLRLTRALLDALFSRSMMQAMGEIMTVLYTGVIILASYQWYPDMVSLIWRVIDDLVNKFSLGNSGSGQAFYSSVTDQVVMVMKVTWKMVFAQKAESSGSAFDFALSLIGQVLSPAFAVHLLLGLLVTVLVAIYGVLMLLQLYTGVLQVSLGTMFYPPTAAFYPVVDSWAKNCVGLIFSGIAHLCICAFLMTIVGAGALFMLNEVQQGNFVFFNVQDLNSAFGDASESMSKALALIMYAVYLIVMGLGTGSAVGYAGKIFGSPSGMIGRMGHGTGAGGAGAGTGGAGSAGSAIGGAGGATGGGAGAAGGVATAGAAVAAGVPTGGAGTAAVGGAGAAASGAGSAAGGAAAGAGVGGAAAAGAGASGAGTAGAGAAGGGAAGGAGAGAGGGGAGGGAAGGSAGSAASGGMAGGGSAAAGRMQAAGARALKTAASVPYRMAVAHAKNIVQS